jgi:1-acyl-sn-glycerol-3-phosphate acyltransferase
MKDHLMRKQPFFAPVQFLVRTLTKFSIIHQANIPKTGGVLLTTNHLSRLDTPLLVAITDRKDMVGIIAKKYQKNTLLKWILERIARMVWMDREATDFSAMREVLHLLRSGHIVGIAPEGTRSKDTKGLLEGKQGAAMMAARTSVPILPVGIIGSDKINHHWLRLRRPPVTIHVGEPYMLPAVDRGDRQAWLSHCTDEIMCQIAALLPPEYHGFYSDHPRLKELLHEQYRA